MDPIVISKIHGNGVVLEAVSPITLTPRYDKESCHWYVEMDEIDLYCYGDDQAELLECIHDFISYDWISYVMCDDALDPVTEELKKNLVGKFNQIL
jgi:hypothetical protein